MLGSKQHHISIDAPHAEKHEFVQKLLAGLTLKEKIGQMTQVWGSKGEERGGKGEELGECSNIMLVEL